MTTAPSCPTRYQRQNTTATVHDASADKGVSPATLLAETDIDPALALDPGGAVTLPQLKTLRSPDQMSSDPYLAISVETA